MKVLIPFDLSDCAKNAIEWCAAFLSSRGEGSIHLYHVVELQRNAYNIVSHNGEYENTVTRKVENAKNYFVEEYPLLNFSSKVVKGDVHNSIVYEYNEGAYDMIVIGTYGNSILKDITVGSTTKYLINTIEGVVLAIPPGVSFNAGLKSVLFATSDQLLEKVSSLQQLQEILEYQKVYVTFLNLHDGEENRELLALSEMVQGSIPHQFVSAKMKGNSLREEIDKFANENEVDLVCFLHKHRGRLLSWLTKSHSTNELIHLHFPLMVIS